MNKTIRSIDLYWLQILAYVKLNAFFYDLLKQQFGI